MAARIAGGVEPGFGLVADAFAENFADPGEDAAALAVYYDGVCVADLWSGTDVVSAERSPDALMMMAPCSKGITATVLAVLVERGEVDPEQSVAAYSPDFASAGKAEVTVGMVAAHTSGLPYPPLGTGLQGLDLHRGPSVTDALAHAAPLWPLGEAMAYHPVTVGTLLDEIVKRATGLSIAQQVRTLIAEPPGLDMWMGLPEAQIDRVIPTSLGPVDGVQLISDATRRRVTAPRTDHVETLIESGASGPDIRFGLGYQLASPGMPGFGPASYGHTGAGGRLGIAPTPTIASVLAVSAAGCATSAPEATPGGSASSRPPQPA